MLELQGGGKLQHALSGDPAGYYWFAGSGGYGYITKLAELVSRPRAGKAFMTLEAGESVLPPVFLERLDGGGHAGVGQRGLQLARQVVQRSTIHEHQRLVAIR